MISNVQRSFFVVVRSQLSMLVIALILGPLLRGGARAAPSVKDQIEEELLQLNGRCGSERRLDLNELSRCRDDVARLLQRCVASRGECAEFGTLSVTLHYYVGRYEEDIFRATEGARARAEARRAAVVSYQACAQILRAREATLKASVPPGALSEQQARLLKLGESSAFALTHADLTLRGVPIDARVIRDGIVQPAADARGLVVWTGLEPGSRVVRIERAGQKAFERVYVLEGGDTRVEDVNLQAFASEPASRWQTPALVTSVVVGVVGFGGAIACHVAASSNEATIDAARDASGFVDPNKIDPARAQRLRDDADALRTWRTVGLVVGGVGAVAAIAFALWPDESPTATVAPVSGGAVMQWRGQF